MNFYRHYIGDFQRDTGHMALAERGAYRALMDHYYATEKGPPADLEACCRICAASSAADRKAVKVAMGMFETKEGHLWHKRIEVEIEKAEGRSNTNRDIALAREAKKRAEKEAQQGHERSTNRGQDVPRTDHALSTKPLTSIPEESKALPRKRGDDEPDGFAEFYAAYPRHVARADAAKAFRKQRLTPSDLPMLLRAISAHRLTSSWQEEGGKYIPYPASWLNDKRWTDEIQQTVIPLRRGVVV